MAESGSSWSQSSAWSSPTRRAARAAPSTSSLTTRITSSSVDSSRPAGTRSVAERGSGRLDEAEHRRLGGLSVALPNPNEHVGVKRKRLLGDVPRPGEARTKHPSKRRPEVRQQLVVAAREDQLVEADV